MFFVCDQKWFINNMKLFKLFTITNTDFMTLWKKMRSIFIFLPYEQLIIERSLRFRFKADTCDIGNSVDNKSIRKELTCWITAFNSSYIYREFLNSLNS